MEDTPSNMPSSDGGSPAVGSSAYFAPTSLTGGPSKISRAGMDEMALPSPAEAAPAEAAPAVGSSAYFAPTSLTGGPSKISRAGMGDEFPTGAAEAAPAVGSSAYFAPRSLTGGPSKISRAGLLSDVKSDLRKKTAKPVAKI
tara:strand:+ start:53 stop:478 length:426 start_codon:yes stop_codon:yes gene_type:complete